MTRQKNTYCQIYLKDFIKQHHPIFQKAAHINPLYHHTQVLENMIKIVTGEQLIYSEIKRASVLALLHDIGNAESIKEKVKNSQIEDAITHAQQHDDPTHWNIVTQLAEKAMAFRLEHMDKGVGMIQQLSSPFVKESMLTDEDIHFICRAVAIHDYPSIEKSLHKLRESGYTSQYVQGDFLLPFDTTPFGQLITYLREADRLFMVTEQGVIKDLKDGKKEITHNNKVLKLESNEKSHRNEYTLYVKAGKDDGKFICETLYRTKTGYSLFQKYIEQK